MGLYHEDYGTDYETMMADHLKLQVDVCFDVQHAFLERNGLNDCKSILDVGTGNGYFCCRLAQQHPDIHFTAIDMRQDMIDSAIATAKELNVSNVEWHLEDITKGLSDSLNKLHDGILERFALPHIDGIELVLKTMQSLVKPNGWMWFAAIDLADMRSEPPHEAIALYKAALEGMYELHGIDGYGATRIPLLLKSLGVEVVAQQKETMSTKAMGNEVFQQFIACEARLILGVKEDLIPDEKLKQIDNFLEVEVAKNGCYADLGVVMIAARV